MDLGWYDPVEFLQHGFQGYQKQVIDVIQKQGEDTVRILELNIYNKVCLSSNIVSHQKGTYRSYTLVPVMAVQICEEKKASLTASFPKLYKLLCIVGSKL